MTTPVFLTWYFWVVLHKNQQSSRLFRLSRFRILHGIPSVRLQVLTEDDLITIKHKIDAFKLPKSVNRMNVSKTAVFNTFFVLQLTRNQAETWQMTVR